MLFRSFEIGLAANDLSTSIPWKVKETRTAKDPVTGNYVTTTLADGKAFTSEVTESYVVTANTRLGPFLVAADATRDGLQQLTGHAGAEIMAGPLALRGGAALDAQKRMQHDMQLPNEPKQIKPGEDVKIVDNRIQVSGQVAVMAINGLLTKDIFDKNPNHDFYVEESFPLD